MNYFKFIRAQNKQNALILDVDDSVLPNSYFNLIKLNRGLSSSYKLPGHESLVVILSGSADVKIDAEAYNNVGKRDNIWSGKAEAVYAGTNSGVTITAKTDNTEIAVAGGKCDQYFSSFRITPDEVEMVDVGSGDTHSRRRIFHILGHNAKGRAGNLLVSELYADEGCWSGYPPHKHDTDNYPEESDFEEIYHYRFNPESGFGGQFCFKNESEHTAFMTRNGDTFAFSQGYHPTVTSPGHAGYIFTILVGKNTRSLIQNFQEEHRHLMNRIPGINDMRDKFK